jgi:multidrug efflux system membrane fusion protein
MYRRQYLYSFTSVLVPFAIGGAAFAQPGGEPPVIPVSQPVKRQITDFMDFSGRTEAVTRVDIRARVGGFLVKTAFKEGGEVRQGDLLFEIDPRPYQAELEQAVAALALSEVRLKRLTMDFQRAKRLAVTKAISQEELDKIAGDVAEGEAALRVPRAAVDVAKLRLSFTKVSAPCDGVIGRSRLAPGNLVKADETALTEIVSQDPMYVYFEMDERKLLDLHRAIDIGRLKRAADGKLRLLMALTGDKGYPHTGELNFIDNRLNPITGAVTARGVFANPKGAAGERLMMPGMLARVRLPIGDPHPALLVTDRAIKTDQGAKLVYVVDAHNKAEVRRITIGALQDDALREIVDGLKEDDWVVVGGMSKLRAPMLVRPEKIPMPVPQSVPAPPPSRKQGALDDDLRKELLQLHGNSRNR